MTTGKRQPPLGLDMDFGEALARFAGVDPKEMPKEPEKQTAGTKPAAAVKSKRPRRSVRSLTGANAAAGKPSSAG